MQNFTRENGEHRLAELERQILGGRPTVQQIQAYYDLCVARGDLDRAHQCFGRLVRSGTCPTQARSLYVSLCLQLGDDRGAMAAIEDLVGSTTAPDDSLIDAALAVRHRLGPMQIAPGADVSLSLCMIARNESKFIGPCLHGIKPLVDEMILVDTGSTDRTADIGHLFGARIFDFEWTNDFALARNFALSRAAGQWVLILDADEAVAPNDFQSIRALMQSGPGAPDAYTIETRNYCHTANTCGWQANAGQYPAHETGLGWFPSRKVRLFRRSPDVRFHFPVHERVEPSLRQNGRAIAESGVPVHHYGHLNEARNLEKARHYFQLGYTKLKEMADDPAAVRELAVQAGQLERWPEAIELWEKLLVLRPDFPEAFINLASAHWQSGAYETSLAWARRALAADPGFKEAHYNAALAHLMLQQHDKAATILTALLRQHPEYLAAAFMLAVAVACSGSADRAAALIRQLKQTAARDALPASLEDISNRMHGAGLVQEVETLARLRDMAA